MLQEPLPTADGFDDGDAEADGDWAGRSAEQRASGAGPAPVWVSAPPSMGPALAIASEVSINPVGHPWDRDQFVAPSAVKALEETLNRWKEGASGGEGEVLTRETLSNDPWQAFAYDIHVKKMDERADLERQGKLHLYRALRMYLTGTAGTGKSRTIRAICGMRRARAAAAGQAEEDVRDCCVLAAPTGCASFQLKFGATTLHRAFGISITYVGPTRDRQKPEFVKRLRRLRTASLFVMDEFSMIGRQMLGKIVYRVEDTLGADRDAGVRKTLGGKDCMMAGDTRQAKAVADEAHHKDGPYKRDGGNLPRDENGKVKQPPPGSKDMSELVAMGVAFRKEFDDVVFLQKRHRLVDEEAAEAEEEKALSSGATPEAAKALREEFVADGRRFADVTQGLGDLSWTREAVSYTHLRAHET